MHACVHVCVCVCVCVCGGGGLKVVLAEGQMTYLGGEGVGWGD